MRHVGFRSRVPASWRACARSCSSCARSAGGRLRGLSIGEPVETLRPALLPSNDENQLSFWKNRAWKEESPKMAQVSFRFPLSQPKAKGGQKPAQVWTCDPPSPPARWSMTGDAHARGDQIKRMFWVRFSDFRGPDFGWERANQT